MSSEPGSSVFVSGNDDEAKATTRELLGDLGWPADAIVDLGDIETARGPEYYFLLLLELGTSLKTGAFNIKVVL
jgi:8-hydroxy-5-deazaflavin:NADPH oxidoreductase